MPRYEILCAEAFDGIPTPGDILSPVNTRMVVALISAVKSAVRRANDLGKQGKHVFDVEVEEEARDYARLRGVRVTAKVVQP